MINRLFKITSVASLLAFAAPAFAQQYDAETLRSLFKGRDAAQSRANDARSEADQSDVRLEAASLLLELLADRADPSGGGISTVNAVPDDYAGETAKIAIGTMGYGVLDMTQISDYPGPWRGRLTQPIMSPDGQYIAAPAGTTIVGTGVLSPGPNQAIHNRMQLTPTALVLPNGTAIPLGGQYVVDRAGVGGVADKVDYHTALTLGGITGGAIISALPELILEAAGADNRTTISDSVVNDLSEEGSNALNRYATLVPTIELRPGTPFQIFFVAETIVPAWRTSDRFKYFTGGPEGNSNR